MQIAPLKPAKRLRRRLVAFILTAVVGLSSVLPGMAAYGIDPSIQDSTGQARGAGFVTNLTGWEGKNGSWESQTDGYRGNNTGIGDGFAMSSVKVEADEAFTYEVDFIINAGNAGGIVFGVADPSNPSADWYCANIDKSGNREGKKDSRIFHVKGDLVFEAGRDLTSEEIDTSEYTLKVTYDGAGNFSSWLNGNPVLENEPIEFQGGYFGLLTYQSDVTFTSATLTKGNGDSGFITNLTGLEGKNGSWQMEEQGYRGNNTNLDDAFAVSDMRVEADRPFTYEASFTINEGDAAGIIFGVENPDNPSANWYCANVDKSGNRGVKDSRIFHVNNGLVYEKGRDLTQEELDTSEYTIKVEYDGDGHFSSYLNGNPVLESEPISFTGGYVGLLTFRSDVTFHNATLTTADEPLNFVTNLSGWQAANGSWQKVANGYRGSNMEIGDAFATADLFLPAGTTFTYEADLTINDGPAAGLVFGIGDRNSPQDKWYCLNVNKQDNNTRFFRINGVGEEKARTLTEEEQAANQFHLKVELAADGTLTCTTNGTEVTSQKLDGFGGGYLGLLTWYSDVTYDNVNVTYQLPEGEYVEPGELIVPTGSSASGNAQDGYILDGAGLGNNFAILDNLVGSFTFEADLQFLENDTAAGLLFGVSDKNNLDNRRWCALHINDTADTARVFYENDYWNPPAGEAFDYTVSLPDTVKHQEIIPLKISVDQEKTVKVYIGNMYFPVITETFAAYSGGYLGFMTSNTSAKFTDVKIYSGEPEDPLDSYELSDLDLGELHGDHCSGNAQDGYIVESINGNNIAVFDGYTTAMEFEADMEILEGTTAAGLMFGVQDKNNPGSNWSAIHIQPDRDNTLRVFCESNWNQPGGLDSGNISLPEGTSDAKMHLKISINLNNVLKVYVNDMENPVYETVFEGYTGGYVGLMTFATKAKFTNVSLKGIEFPQLSGLELIGAPLNEEFDPTNYDYTADAAMGTESVKVKATLEKGSLQINGVPVASGEESEEIRIGTGQNTITVLVTSEDGVFSRAVKIVVTKPYNTENPYQETYRPQFHFSQQQYWCNDPNGMVYNAETQTYHLFYQYNPGVLYHDGQSHWGHAVSKDMVHWTELPIALYPDDIGIMASGSGVIDRNNTSGLFDESTPPESRMVAIYTYFANGPAPGEGGSQRQAIAYSEDNGLTWTKYEGNSVIPNFGNEYGGDFRDPKVMWMEETQEWLMIVAGGRARIFTSPDLIHWTHNTDLVYADNSEVFSECPDLFPLAVDGDPDNIKWVYSGSGVFYIIGDLVKENGTYVFKAETNRMSLYEGGFGGGAGGDMYATQSFSNMPDGRTVLISWMPESNAEALKAYDKNWNGNQSIPLEAKLYTVDGEVRLATYPVEELKMLRSEEPIYEGSNITVVPGDENILKDVNGYLYDIEAEFTLNGATEFGFNLRTSGDEKTVVKYNVADQKLIVDKSASGVLSTGVKSATLTPIDGNKIKLRILVDTSVIDAFGNDGLASVNTFYYPGQENSGMEFYTVGGNVTVDSMKIYEMASAWDETVPVPVVPLLTSLDISEGTLSPAFDPTVNEYKVTVANDVDSLDVTPVYAWATTVSGTINGEAVDIGETKTIPLTVGDNTITITLKDRVSQNTYTITVTREGAAQTPVLDGLELSQGALSPNFGAEVKSYTAQVANDVESIQVKALFGENVKVKINDAEVASGTFSDAIPLAVGENTITVSLTGNDGGTNSYTIVVTREKDGDIPAPETPVLDDLQLSHGTLDPEFAPNVTEYKASVAYAVNNIQVKAFFADEIAVKINGVDVQSGIYCDPIPLSVGENTITVSLTGSDGGANTYTIVVTRADQEIQPGGDGSISGGGSDWRWPDGTTSDTDTDKDKENPSSGDAANLPMALALLAGTSALIVFASRKKK